MHTPTSSLQNLLLALCLLLTAPLLRAQTATPTAANAAAGGGHAAHGPRTQLASGAALAPDGSLWLVGLDAQQQLTLRRSTDLQSWSEPRVLDTGGEPISADGENRPKIAFGQGGQVVISYTRPLDKPYTGWIRMLRSTDGGATFSKPFTVHHDTQEITHRFESIAFDASGALHVLWIDKRDLLAAGKGYTGAAIYQAVSLDGGQSFGPDTKVADHSCECCRIALAQGADGKLSALWRHVFANNTRDHAFARLDGAAPNTFQRASFDEWQINACPHHGPGLAPAADGGYHAVWFGARKGAGAAGQPAVRYGRLGANGQPVAGTLRLLPDAQAEHADVAAHGQQVAIVWRSFQGGETALKAWLSRDGGKNFELRVLATQRGNNDHPRLVSQGSRMLVVWRNETGAPIYDIAF